MMTVQVVTVPGNESNRVAGMARCPSENNAHCATESVFDAELFVIGFFNFMQFLEQAFR